MRSNAEWSRPWLLTFALGATAAGQAAHGLQAEQDSQPLPRLPIPHLSAGKIPPEITDAATDKAARGRMAQPSRSSGNRNIPVMGSPVGRLSLPPHAGPELMAKPPPAPRRANFDDKPRVSRLTINKARPGQATSPGRDACHRTPSVVSYRDRDVLTRLNGGVPPRRPGTGHLPAQRHFSHLCRQARNTYW